MSLKTVYQKLQKLENTSSSNDKVDLLREYLKDPLFHKVVWCCLNGTLHYNIKKFPDYVHPGLLTPKGNEFIFAKLKELSKKSGATNEDKQELARLAAIDKETFEVVKRICQKDLKCNVAERLINKARPNTIKIFPYQRCKTSKEIANIKFLDLNNKPCQAIVQCKADGEFTNMFIDDKFGITFRTRNGKLIRQLEHLKQNIQSQSATIKYGRKRGIIHSEFPDRFKNQVFMGELRVWNKAFTEILDRQTGNGIISQCLQGTADPKDAKRVFFTVWENVPIQDFWEGISKTSYSTRFYASSVLTSTVNNAKHVQTIQKQHIDSINEAYDFYVQMRREGHEGAIVKNLSFNWRDQQSGSPDMIKLKHCFDCDLVVIGYEKSKEGGQFDGLMGAILCASSCGKLKVKIGSGFTPEMREWDWDMIIGSIVMTEAERTITSKTKDTHSLYTPSFIKIREDKDKADTLEQIFTAEKESKRNKRRK